ncbi:MAG: RHS repeat-associated core domain-containing protein, partial [Planctomycetes bacterium]|nr:RHS repeat-associated core domain-containing protein [Planctomycetota bacterium]
WETLFAGYHVDSATVLYQIRHRLLTPLSGNWLTRDPLGIIGDVNTYLYTDSDPISGIDPMGLMQDCTKKACKECVDEAENNATYKALIAMGTVRKKIGLFTWTEMRPGCKPNVTCSDDCKLKEGGVYEKGKIKLCFKEISLNVTKAGGRCGAVIETLLHEYIHQLNDCLKHDLGGIAKDDCSKTFCDEVTAYRTSGMCSKGSAWFTIKGYTTVEDCLIESARVSSACTFKKTNDELEAYFVSCIDPFKGSIKTP